VASKVAGYRLIQGTIIERMAMRIKRLIEENSHLTFWFSTSMLISTGPSVFIGASVIGVACAMNNHFGLREHSIKHLSWETTQGLVSALAFVCGLLFHYHIQCAWGGVAAGSHLYRVCNGQVYKCRLSGWSALDEEMRLLTREFASWVQILIPFPKTKPKIPANAYRFILQTLPYR
jgi:hypothetical protein